jgi:hypothetical protein
MARLIMLSEDRTKFTAVNEVDFLFLNQHKWHVMSHGYVARFLKVHGERCCVRMSRVILSAPDKWVVDHINHIPLDNRRGNLRLCTQGQNSLNSRRSRRKILTNGSLRFRCVFRTKGRLTWSVRIVHKGQQYYGGTHADEEEAARQYDLLALQLKGDFAPLNFPLRPVLEELTHPEEAAIWQRYLLFCCPSVAPSAGAPKDSTEQIDTRETGKRREGEQ